MNENDYIEAVEAMWPTAREHGRDDLPEAVVRALRLVEEAIGQYSWSATLWDMKGNLL